MLIPKALLFASTLSLLPFAAAQEPIAPAARSQAAQQFTLRGLTVRLWQDAGVPKAAVSHDGGRSWRQLRDVDNRLYFRFAQHDPLLEPVMLPGALGAAAGGRLFVVQFVSTIQAEYRTELEQRGIEIVGYMPENAYFVRCDRELADAIGKLPCVRWVGGLQVGFKLEEQLVNVAAEGGNGEPVEYNVVLARKSDRDLLVQQIGQLGGTISFRNDGSVYLKAKLTPGQLAQVAGLDTVTWIDRTTELSTDMNNARIQGGANYIESVGGFTGTGIRGEISEGLDNAHPDWTLPPIVHQCNSVESHGNCTAGIVFGNGSGNPMARGMLPNGQALEASYNCWSNVISRYTLVQQLVNPALSWHGMFQTASWGSTQTTAYTSVSVEMDNLLFDFDVPLTQSQSNTGDQRSRPQAWAKNIISVGGVRHRDNASASDDTWGGGGSIGPAIDGRIKPDISAYYDLIFCLDRVGTAGYNTSSTANGGNYYNNFGGTSGATPIVAGHVGLILEMQTDGLFGNELPLPATPNNRFANRPHMTSTKALLLNTARQYPFVGTTADLTRTHVGYGFPDLQRCYDDRKQTVVVDEYETLTAGHARDYLVWIAPGAPEFRSTMIYADPQAAANATIHRINNVDLSVTRLSDNTRWWGNNGLTAGNYSTAGGIANDRDTVENVILNAPTSGIYDVRVAATSVVQDGHIETPQLDVDFALVMRPLGGGYHDDSGLTVDLVSTAPGDLRVQATNVPASGWTDGYTLISTDTARPLGFGKFFGLEDDFLVPAIWALPATAGDVLHFTNSGAANYPYATFTMPPALALALSGLTLDGMVVLFNNGPIVAMSNVDRVTVQ